MISTTCASKCKRKLQSMKICLLIYISCLYLTSPSPIWWFLEQQRRGQIQNENGLIKLKRFYIAVISCCNSNIANVLKFPNIGILCAIYSLNQSKESFRPNNIYNLWALVECTEAIQSGMFCQSTVWTGYKHISIIMSKLTYSSTIFIIFSCRIVWLYEVCRLVHDTII